MIEAVVFDFDGLVFDSETHEYETVAELFAEHGAELPLDVWGQCIGREAGFFDPYAYLEERTGARLDRDELDARRRARFHQRIEGQGPIPGVEEALRAARSLGLKIGLASSSHRAWVEPQLRRLGLWHYFRCVRTADDVERVKPDPELYRSVLACLGVEPSRAVAFEDSPNGALAARRAGMFCVVVPNRMTTALEFGEHDVRLESLMQAELADLLARIAASARKTEGATGAPSPSPETAVPGQPEDPT
ncbi:HAD family hydrolase [Longimicrobium sp.]|uniref:HAD family hydrolase n=1 Tax=Longimicrobium sp. TaxID=2029185 RepID=UPI002C26AC85|nr:HAD family hydrolase [Longimicrobium sp.]HSU15653.1 HAD family hydrolase [Longimicrobium sp.]